MRASGEISKTTLTDVDLLALIDPAKVEAALDAPFEKLGGILLYPDRAEQAGIVAARLPMAAELPNHLELLVALLLVELILESAGATLIASPTELDSLFRQVGEGKLTDDQLIRWMMLIPRHEPSDDPSDQTLPPRACIDTFREHNPRAHTRHR